MHANLGAFVGMRENTKASLAVPAEKMPAAGIQLGIDIFVETSFDPATRISDLLEKIELTDQVGLDVFGVGEHHRAE